GGRAELDRDLLEPARTAGGGQEALVGATGQQAAARRAGRRPAVRDAVREPGRQGGTARLQLEGDRVAEGPPDGGRRGPPGPPGHWSAACRPQQCGQIARTRHDGVIGDGSNAAGRQLSIPYARPGTSRGSPRRASWTRVRSQPAAERQATRARQRSTSRRAE